MRIGLIQMTSGIDPERNAATLERDLAAVAAEGAHIAFTPEMSGCLDKNRERLMATATTEAKDPVLARVREVAKKTGLWIHLGSLALKSIDAEKLVNRGFLISPDGEVAASYDKIHLFDVDLGEGERYGESRTFQGGTRPALADAEGATIGMTICYDVRFPRLFDRLSEAGAQILSVPAAFTVPTGEAHWHLLLRARAVENSCFVIAAAQAGAHEDGRTTYGHSLVVDPWGEVLLDMGTEPGHAVCDLELERISEIRRKLPSHEHRTHIEPL